MKITTKFNLGDEVWFIYNNQVRNSTIISIGTNTNGKALLGGGQTHIGYHLANDPATPSGWDESKLFPTKSALLASL